MLVSRFRPLFHLVTAFAIAIIVAIHFVRTTTTAAARGRSFAVFQRARQVFGVVAIGGLQYSNTDL